MNNTLKQAEALVAFLLGEDELNGEWFERPLNERGQFWWRKNLRETMAPLIAEHKRMAEALAQRDAAPVGEVVDNLSPSLRLSSTPPPADKVVVPVEPTEAMYRAMADAWYPGTDGWNEDDWKEVYPGIRQIYKAALTAAQEKSP